MEDNKHIFSIVKMSETLGVSRSGYYRWRNRPPSNREVNNTRFKTLIKKIWLNPKKTYSSPPVHAALLADGEQLSRPRVARLMKKAGIASQIRPAWVATTDSSHTLPVAANLLDRNFSADHLAQKWVSDITYIPSRNGWLYLTTARGPGRPAGRWLVAFEQYARRGHHYPGF